MKLNHVEPVVESLSQGPLLRRILALALRVLAVVVGFAGLFFILGLLGRVINVISHDVPQAIGMLVALAMEVIVFFLAVKILLFRARCILIQPGDDYPMVNLSALALRTAGELLALFYSGIGLVAGIAIWFGGDFSIVPGMWQFLLFPAPPFILGVVMILASQLYALLVLVVLYLLAELLLLLRNIAVNTNK